MERRQANDGQWYTYEDFCEHYGYAGARQWDAAKQEVRPQHSDVKPLAEEAPRNRDTYEDGSKRMASDGYWYTLKEFCEYYTEDGQRQWDLAAKLGTEPSRHGTQVVSVSENSVVRPHPEALPTSSGACALPNDTTAETARTPTLPDLTLAQIPVLTITQLNNMRQEKG